MNVKMTVTIFILTIITGFILLPMIPKPETTVTYTIATITQTTTTTITTTYRPPETTVTGSIQITGIVLNKYTIPVTDQAYTAYFIMNKTDSITLTVTGFDNSLQYGKIYEISALQFTDGTHRITKAKLLTSELQNNQAGKP